MISLCTDIGYRSVKKHGETLCGDNVEVIEQEDGSVVMVLADGLGSGVKANILSILTSKIISTMMARSMGLEACVAAVAATLPICAVRGIAYSTFTVIRVSPRKNGELDAEIIQYDNPDVIMIRDGKCVSYPTELEKINDKPIFKTKIPLRENDAFILVSDGVTHAGLGRRLNFGWEWENVANFMAKSYRREYTAKKLTSILLEECAMLYDDEPGDDTTVCAMKVRRRNTVNLMFGPPSNPNDVPQVMSDFFSQSGKHVVCGGTTSSLAAQHLGSKITVALDYADADIPPVAVIDGVDLATEGVITISRVLQYCKDYAAENRHYSRWIMSSDGASRLSRLLFEESTDVHFFVGKAINPAHQNPDLPIGFSIKMHLIEELSNLLKKMGKRVTLRYS